LGWGNFLGCYGERFSKAFDFKGFLATRFSVQKKKLFFLQKITV